MYAGQSSISSSDDSDFERMLVDAVMNGDAARLVKSLEAATDPQELLNKKISLARPTNHSFGKAATLLQLASYRTRGDGDTVSVLLDAGAEIDIHSACGLGMTDRIAEILDNSPDDVSKQVDTYYPLQFAITGKRVESIDCLMLHGDDPNRNLKKVAYFGWEDEVVDCDYTPWKPIHMASLYSFDASRVPVAECLAKHGADLNAVSPLDGFRPIHLVAMSNRVDMIKFLSASGVDVDSRSQECRVVKASSENDGPVAGFECTPLMIACAEGFLEATQCLIDLGADTTARNSDGKSPADFAQQRFWNGQPYDQILELLQRHVSDGKSD